MHPNPIFRKADTAKNIRFAQMRSFGAVCVQTNGAPSISHIPFSLSKDGTYREAHIVRSNPVAKVLEYTPAATMVVSGQDAYILTRLV